MRSSVVSEQSSGRSAIDDVLDYLSIGSAGHDDIAISALNLAHREDVVRVCCVGAVK